MLGKCPAHTLSETDLRRTAGKTHYVVGHGYDDARMLQSYLYNTYPIPPEHEYEMRLKGPVSFSTPVEREPALYYIAEDNPI